MIEVRLESVGKSYDGISDAIPNLNLICRRGEMLALLGPSGCGKSSTLKMIAGIEPVTRGAIYFQDVDVSRQSTASRNVAMVFEDYALYPHMTVWGNIAFPLQIRSMSRPDIRNRVNRVLDMLGLQDMRDDSVKELSGGAQQRVSIGRALVREPSLVMFDEPLSHLDADQKIQLRTEIKRLQKISRLTSVLVTHDQNEAIAMADRIAVMNKGILQQVDIPSVIYNEPANIFVAGFIGEPPMNLLNAYLSQQDGGASLIFEQGFSVTLGAREQAIVQSLADGQNLVVGIRPEHIVPGSHETLATLSGVVTSREAGGDSEVLATDTVVGRITAEVASPAGLKEGDAVTLGFDSAHLHFFCARTGANLLARSLS